MTLSVWKIVAFGFFSIPACCIEWLGRNPYLFIRYIERRHDVKKKVKDEFEGVVLAEDFVRNNNIRESYRRAMESDGPSTRRQDFIVESPLSVESSIFLQEKMEQEEESSFIWGPQNEKRRQLRSQRQKEIKKKRIKEKSYESLHRDGGFRRSLRDVRNPLKTYEYPISRSKKGNIVRAEGALSSFYETCKKFF